MQFVILGLLIVLFIGFCVVVWKAARDWRWYQITGAVITMILAITFVFPVAGVLKSRSEWHKVHEELTVRLEQSKKEQERLKIGDPADPTAGEGLVSLSQKLSKLGVEAGRRWRGLQLQSFNNNVITLTAPVEDAAVAPDAEPAPAAAGAAAAAQPPAPLIPDGLVVYGFAETVQPDTTAPIPTFFLGEFRVTSTSPTQVTLTPTGPLEGPQQQAISSRQASSWSIYEMLPLDGHEPFIAAGSVPDEDNYFGRVDEELVRRLLGQRVNETTLSDYLRDGSRSTPDDPPLSRWVRIEFTKNHNIDVDSPDQRGALDGGFFDPSGRAVDSRLQRGADAGPIAFKAGTQILVKEEAANQLIDEGVATLKNTFFLRPMNDYRFVLRRIRLRIIELAIRKQELEFEQKVLQDAINATVAMLTVNQTMKLKLEQDFAQTEVEKKAISEYHQKLTQDVAQTRETLNRLYISNQSLEKQLNQIHSTIEQRIESLTRAN